MLRRAINHHNRQQSNENRPQAGRQQSTADPEADTQCRLNVDSEVDEEANKSDLSTGSFSWEVLQEVPLSFSSWRLVQILAVNAIFAHAVFDSIEVSSLKQRVYKFAGPCPSGVKIVVSTGGAVCTIFDVSTGAVERHIMHDPSAGLRAQAYWSPCGMKLATIYGPTIRITDAMTGEIKYSIEYPGELMEGFAWCPSGTKFATGARGGQVRVFDSETSDLQGEISLGLGGISHKGVDIVAWSPGLTELAITARRPPTVDIVHVDSVKIKRAIPHTGQVSACQWSPCGQRIGTGENEHPWKRGTARIIHAQSGIIEHEIRHTSWVQEVAWSPCGRWICTASSDGVARIINTQTGKVEQKLCPGGESVAWSPSGDKLATCRSVIDHVAGQTFVLRTFIVHTWEVEHEVRYDGVGSALAWSPCGRKLAIGSHRSAPDSHQAGWVYIINAQTGIVQCNFSVQHGTSVLNISFSR